MGRAGTGLGRKDVGVAASAAAAADKAEAAPAQLTGLEGIVLTQIGKGNGIIPYEIMRIISRSPVAALSASPGAVYPVVKRLRARGFIAAAAPDGHGKGSDGLLLTDAGREALAGWAGAISADDVLPQEPLLSKVGAFMVLSKAQRIRALFSARTAIDERLDRLDSVLAEGADADSRPPLDGARALLKAKRAWVEAFLLEVADD